MNKFAIKSNKSVDFDYPDEEEMKTAMKICCGRCCSACETPAEYAWRKRKVDMAELVEIAVENELTEKEKDVIRKLYYEDKKVSELNGGESARSSNYRTVNRALEKLRNSLKYVYMYQHDFIPRDDFLMPVEESLTMLSAKHKRSEDLASKLATERIKRGISLRKASAATGISRARLEKIEGGDTAPDIDELSAVCHAYGISAENLLK